MKLAGWSPLTAPEKTSIIEGSVKGEYKLAEPAINVFAKLSISSACQGGHFRYALWQPAKFHERCGLFEGVQIFGDYSRVVRDMLHHLIQRKNPSDKF